MKHISGWMVSSISKPCVVGRAVIHTYCMSHQCIPKKIRFSAVYRPATSLGRTSSVSKLASYCEWELLPSNDNRVFLGRNRWYGLGQYVTKWRRHKWHNECHNWLFENKGWWTFYLSPSQLAASVVGFGAVRLFPVLQFQVYGLCQQASGDWWTSYEHRTWNCSTNSWFILENRGNWFRRLDFRKRARRDHVKEVKFAKKQHQIYFHMSKELHWYRKTPLVLFKKNIFIFENYDS